MTKNKYLSLAIITLITFAAPAIGSYATSTFKEPWYSEIILPSFNPPSWVFAPVWSSLYLMMSLAIWKIWINTFDIKLLKIYFVHILFNSTWTIVFFGFHQIGLALLNLIIILIFILILMKEYFKKDKISFYLMVPYISWSSYALVLNTAIFILNYFKVFLI